MPGIFIHNYGNDVPDPVYGPLAASQTYKSGDPVGVSSNAIAVCPTDGTEILEAECVGFAGQGALGEQAASRTGLTYGGGVGGAATGSFRSFYWAGVNGLLLRTKNFWVAATPGTQQAKTGASRYGYFQLSSSNVADDVAQWGVENTTGVVDTDFVVQIVDVLDNNMQPVAAGDTLTAGDGWVVFRVVSNVLTNPFAAAHVGA